MPFNFKGIASRELASDRTTSIAGEGKKETQQLEGLMEGEFHIAITCEASLELVFGVVGASGLEPCPKKEARSKVAMATAALMLSTSMLSAASF
ncbi:hypothetical protein Droror1_Dr00009430 [Drosera rotundifolia]